MTAQIFLRCLSVIYFIAFWSLGTQILGLIGVNGVLPVADYLNASRDYWGASFFWHTPTICWLNHADDFLLFLCFLGVFCSVLLLMGILPALNALILWGLYLSLTVVGQVFLGFQWDNLLLEAGFISIFLFPFSLRIDPEATPPLRAVEWLLRLLLFKLMLQSGVVKLLSRDSSWADLTALTYHYWTQPIPNFFSWYINQFPVWFHKFSCSVMFFIELVVPFFIFFGRRLRIAAFYLLSALQVMIMLSGNYAFFNLLTLVLCITLLDDAFFKGAKTAQQSLPLKIAGGGIAAVILFLSVSQALSMTNWRLPQPVVKVLNELAPWRTINNYGLFAVMTKQRDEIIIEGSDNGIVWKAYEFHWKPGTTDKAPSWTILHQPRLDWQMWFAALGDYSRSPWLVNTMVRILDDSKQVLELFKYNPFKAHPPKYIRALMYQYRFTTMLERRTTLNWWKREYKGVYIPAFSLK